MVAAGCHSTAGQAGECEHSLREHLVSWHSSAYVEGVQVHLRAQHAPQLALQQEAHDALQRPVCRAAQHAAGRCADPPAAGSFWLLPRRLGAMRITLGTPQHALLA